MSVEKEKNLPRQNEPSWAAGVQVFSEISGWIVGPIVLALIAGKALDAHFGTKPYIFFALAAFGFLITIYGIVKVVKKFMKKVKE